MIQDQIALEAAAIADSLTASDGRPIDAYVVVHMRDNGMRLAGTLSRVTPTVLVMPTLEGRGERVIAMSQVAQVEITR